MAKANQFTHPIAFYGEYKTNSWAGYYFKETLGYTTGRHTGVDYNGPGGGDADRGLPLVAVANGRVLAIEDKTGIGYGLTTIIEHTLSKTLAAQLGVSSIASRYMHQQNVKVSVGQEVTIGQQIAEVGKSGTQWAHAHVDLYKNTIEGGLVHWRYDKDTELQSYLDTYEYIDARLSPVDTETGLLPYQRVVEDPAGVKHRTEPNTSSPLVITDGNPDGIWEKGEILDFAGFVHGQSVENNDTWFVGRYSGGYMWSGVFNGGADTTGLSDLTPEPPKPPDPEDPPYTFTKDLDCVTEVIPAALGNFEYGNFPTNPTKLVLHDFGTEGLNTYQSVINEFTKKGTEKSAHFVISKGHTTQMVALKDRAYGAGPQGNNYVQVESDPAQDPDTVTRGKKLREELKSRYGYDVEFIKHSSIVSTQCGDDIDLEMYEFTAPPSPEDPRIEKMDKFLTKTFKEY